MGEKNIVMLGFGDMGKKIAQVCLLATFFVLCNIQRLTIKSLAHF